MGTTSLEDWLEWLWGLLTGWLPVPDTYEHKAGDHIKLAHTIKNIGAIAADDNEVLDALETVPNSQIEDDIYHDCGGRITILSRDAKTVEPGREWDHKIEYKCTEASPFPIAVVVYFIGIAIVLYLLIDFTEEVKSIGKEIGAGPMNLFLIAIIGVVILFILVFIKSMLD